MAFVWNEENKAEVEALYLGKMEELAKANPDAEPSSFSMEAVNYAAAQVGTSGPSARMQLSKLNVYVKMQPTKSKAKATSGEGSKRVGKADAQGELLAAFKDCGVENLDEDILTKLTGKAALHLAEKVREAFANLSTAQ